MPLPLLLPHEQGMANDAKAPLSMPLPPLLSLREQARDGQQCQGTVNHTTIAAIVVVERASRDGQC
jgi:hypothetical protein